MQIRTAILVMLTTSCAALAACSAHSNSCYGPTSPDDPSASMPCPEETRPAPKQTEEVPQREPGNPMPAR